MDRSDTADYDSLFKVLFNTNSVEKYFTATKTVFGFLYSNYEFLRILRFIFLLFSGSIIINKT